MVVERLRWRRNFCSEEFAYLRARAARPVKVTIISAQHAAAWYEPDKSAGAYPTREAYLADVVDITRREVAELVRLGCTYIQIDGPHYAALLDPQFREGFRQRGANPDRMMEACIEMENAVMGSHPGVTFGLHVCRGNNRSMFLPGGGYEPIAARNGAEALGILSRGTPPALMLLDLRMPVMDGWQFRREQKQDAAIADIPLIVITATGKRPVLIDADELVMKPLDLTRLFDAIDRYC